MRDNRDKTGAWTAAYHSYTVSTSFPKMGIISNGNMHDRHCKAFGPGKTVLVEEHRGVLLPFLPKIFSVLYRCYEPKMYKIEYVSLKSWMYLR